MSFSTTVNTTPFHARLGLALCAVALAATGVLVHEFMQPDVRATQVIQTTRPVTSMVPSATTAQRSGRKAEGWLKAEQPAAMMALESQPSQRISMDQVVESHSTSLGNTWTSLLAMGTLVMSFLGLAKLMTSRPVGRYTEQETQWMMAAAVGKPRPKAKAEVSPEMAQARQSLEDMLRRSTMKAEERIARWEQAQARAALEMMLQRTAEEAKSRVARWEQTRQETDLQPAIEATIKEIEAKIEAKAAAAQAESEAKSVALEIPAMESFIDKWLAKPSFREPQLKTMFVDAAVPVEKPKAVTEAKVSTTVEPVEQVIEIPQPVVVTQAAPVAAPVAPPVEQKEEKPWLVKYLTNFVFSETELKSGETTMSILEKGRGVAAGDAVAVMSPFGNPAPITPVVETAAVAQPVTEAWVEAQATKVSPAPELSPEVESFMERYAARLEFTETQLKAMFGDEEDAEAPKPGKLPDIKFFGLPNTEVTPLVDEAALEEQAKSRQFILACLGAAAVASVVTADR